MVISNYHGLKIGLEIHFQLATSRKLFCHCPTKLVTNITGSRVIRRLRPTQSELGQIDPAAYFEFQKGTIIEYIAPEDCTCLVELDEEPPHEICEEALATAIAVAKFLKSKILDEFHVMRKVVIDGSNTTGFQRTLLIALGGYINVNGKKINIQSICLEEEAARLIKREDNKVTYCLDRLGIPLIEIATAPEIESPEEAIQVAEYLGRIVTATGMRRRGIGSIRQDINISVMGEVPVEIKGVQKLTQLKKVIEFEYKRQISLLKIRDELRRRGLRKEDLKLEYFDVTHIFNATKSKLIKKLLSKGYRVYTVKLPKFKGLLILETAPNYRLGKEFAERVRFWTGLGGLIHSDELPGYGISEDEASKVKNLINCKENDAFILIISDEEKVQVATEKIIERAKEAIKGIPKETRAAHEDGSTFYMRPRPGMARMYPETDIPPIRINRRINDLLNRIAIRDPYEIVKSVISKYSINKEQAWMLYDEGLIHVFQRLVKRFNKLKPTYIATVILDFPKILEREGLDTSKITDDIIEKTIEYVNNGVIAKESIIDLWKDYIKTGEATFEDILRKYELGKVPYEEIRKYIYESLPKIKNFNELPGNIKRKKLIGFAMSRFRGKVNPKVVVSIVDELLDKLRRGEINV